MECEKCKDKGFTEQEHGLVMVFCDCEKGKELQAEITGQPTGETVTMGSKELLGNLEIILNDNPIDSGDRQPDTDFGSGNPSQPKKPKKPKAKKKARARAC